MWPASPETLWTSLDTPFGRCRLGWSARGVARFRLPETAGEDDAGEENAEDHATAARPDFVASTLAELERYFAGEPVTFAAVPLDLSGVPDFNRTIYDALRRIGWGETATYGSLAQAVGEPGAARAVGRAMGANPIPVIIPCHRVLAAGRRMGGFSAPGGTTTKQHLLELEGVQLEETRQMGFGF